MRVEGRFRALAGGFLAAAIALSVGQFGSSLSSRLLSPVVAVGELVVDLTPGSVVRTTIGTFGTMQKPLLLAGIVVVSLLLGALLSWRAPSRLPVALAAFGAVGGWAMARSPLTSAATSWSLAVIMVGTGLVVVRRAPVSRSGDAVEGDTFEDPRIKYADRRGFLLYSGGLSATAVALVGAGRVISDRSAQEARSRFELPTTTTSPPETTSRPTSSTPPSTSPPAIPPTSDPPTTTTPPTTTAPPPSLPDIDGLDSWITPNADFYRIDTALTVPIVDPVGWSMRIDGLVEQPISLTLDDLLVLDILDATITIACVSNTVGGSLVGNATWTGVLLADVLDLAQPQEGAEQVMAWSVDGFSAGFPLETATDGRTALVAFGMNGEPLPLDHGFPVRLIVPGLYGYVSAVKWLSHLELTNFDRDGYWIDKGWSKDAPVKIASRIDVPATRRVEAGTVPVAGVAWYPDIGVAAVEVSIDSGPWQPCQLGEAGASQGGKPAKTGESWVQWLYLWEATPGRHRIRVRAAGSDGTLQPGLPVAPAPNGAEGYHEISVTVA